MFSLGFDLEHNELTATVESEIDLPEWSFKNVFVPGGSHEWIDSFGFRKNMEEIKEKSFSLFQLIESCEYVNFMQLEKGKVKQS